jgi:ABC-2 type transport system ATP-binding protein
MTAMLATSRLTRTFPGFALREIDLSLEAGSILALVGPNGAGKTTFMKLVMGILPAQSGTVTVCGFPQPQDLVEIRNRVGFVPDEPPFLPDRRVGQVAELAATFFRGWDPGEFGERLRDFGIDQDLRVRSLSRGRKTLLALAVALAHEPDLLLLDEPFAGLDAARRRQILRLVHEYVADGRRAAVIATHQTDGLAPLADRTAFLDAGRLILDRPTEDLLADWKWLRYRQGCLDPDLESRLRSRESGALGCRGLVSSYADFEAALGPAVAAGDVQVAAASIDDILISLTEGS